MAFTNANGRTQSSLADINVTPLVDVVLVLLIIFMVTAPVLQSGIDVEVPHTKTVKEITEQRTVVTIDKDQRVFLGSDIVNINALPDLIKQKVGGSNPSIYVRVDEKCSFWRICDRNGRREIFRHYQRQHRYTTDQLEWLSTLTFSNRRNGWAVPSWSRSSAMACCSPH